jgi:hypothetical protein
MKAESLQALLASCADRLICGEAISPGEREAAANAFLEGAQPYDGREFTAWALRSVYWHAPRIKGRFSRNFTGILPKTAIFADNFLELEILRFLCAGPERVCIREMRDVTLRRLEHACFGHFCPEGECAGASVSALRFYNAAAPGIPAAAQIAEGLTAFYRSLPGGMSAYAKNLPRFYVFLALTDTKTDAARTFLSEQTDFMCHMLTRGCLTGPAAQDTYNVRLLYILRSALATVDGYAYVSTRPVIIREDGRCVCDI